MDETGSGAEPGRAGRTWWQTALLLVVTATVLVLVLALVAPRWWGSYIGDRVDDRGEVGVGLGLVVGFVCTLVPLMILLHGRHVGTWRARLAVVGAALVVALPNLMTLLVVTGATSGAEAGLADIDRDAPGFRAGSLVGSVLALVGYPLLLVLLASWRSRGRELDAHRRAEAERSKADRAAPAPSGAAQPPSPQEESP